MDSDDDTLNQIINYNFILAKTEMFFLIIILIVIGHITCWPDPHLRSRGAIWPEPQFIAMGNGSKVVHPESFKFISTIGKCEIIDKAISRYHKRLFGKIPDKMSKISNQQILDEVGSF